MTHLPRKDLSQHLRMAGCFVPDIAAFMAWDHSTKVDCYLTWPGPRELKAAAGRLNYVVERIQLDPTTIAEFQPMTCEIFSGLDEDAMRVQEVCTYSSVLHALTSTHCIPSTRACM